MEGTGVFETDPKSAPDCEYRETIYLGESQLTSTDIRKALDNISGDFQAKQYSLVYKNCNSFSDAFSKQLLGVGIPGWVNRLSWLGQGVSCCLPEELLGGSGPQADGPDVKRFSAFTGTGQALGASNGTGGETTGSASLLGSFLSSATPSQLSSSSSSETAPLLSATEDAETRRRKAASAALARFGGPPAGTKQD